MKSTALVGYEGGNLGFCGLEHNRSWVVWSPADRLIITAKRRNASGLLRIRSQIMGGESAISRDGKAWHICGEAKADELLSELLGHAVKLVPVSEVPGLLTNFGFRLKSGLGVDSSPVHAITMQSLVSVGFDLAEGASRYRPTFVIDLHEHEERFPEDGWPRYTVIRVGQTVMAVRKLAERCPEPGWERLGIGGAELPASRSALQHARRVVPGGGVNARMWLGVYLSVVEPGQIHVGDDVCMLM